jgi:hypothetical protein
LRSGSGQEASGCDRDVHGDGGSVYDEGNGRMTNVCGTSGRIRSRGGGFAVLVGVFVALGLWMLVPGVLAGRADDLRTESSAAPRRWTIDYRLKSAGQVFLAVYDAEGRLVRTLLQGQKQQPGEHRTEWDGLDRNGNPMPRANTPGNCCPRPGLRRSSSRCWACIRR